MSRGKGRALSQKPLTPTCTLISNHFLWKQHTHMCSHNPMHQCDCIHKSTSPRAFILSHKQAAKVIMAYSGIQYCTCASSCAQTWTHAEVTHRRFTKALVRILDSMLGKELVKNLWHQACASSLKCNSAKLLICNATKKERKPTFSIKTKSTMTYFKLLWQTILHISTITYIVPIGLLHTW